MSPGVRDLETNLSNIRQKCAKAIDEVTGVVDQAVITAQAFLFKQWIWDLENAYIDIAKRRPMQSGEISSKGRELVNSAWAVYETLLELEQRAGEPPRPLKHEQIPSGVVSGEIKSTVLLELRDMERKYEEFREKILKT